MGFSMYMQQQHGPIELTGLAAAMCHIRYTFLACLTRPPPLTHTLFAKVYLMGPGHVSTSMQGVKECVHNTKH